MLGRLLLGLALCGIAHATPPPRIDLETTPAWKGWVRPGRSTELDIRVAADAAMRATLEVVAGRQTVRSDIDLQPGRAVRLHIPLTSSEKVTVSVGAPSAVPQRRDVGLSTSESPLLCVGLATGDQVRLEGFHTVALAADDLPRSSSAYSAVDALILDAPTLGMLDPRQIGALLAHAAACGRIVVLNADARVRRAFDGRGGCGGRALMHAASLDNATAMLKSSLAGRLPQSIAPGGLGELVRPAHVIWNRVAVALAAYFAAALLAVMFFSSLPVLLLSPALAAMAALALLNAMQPGSQLLVWSEGDSGAQVARYQAWQQFPGLFRQSTRVPIPPQLASAVQPCDPTQPVRFDFDASRGSVTFAEFDTRLFRQVALCYSGSFPMSRAIAVEARADGLRDVRNAGTMAWPQGVLLAGGLAHDLPALGPGAHTIVDLKAGRPLRDAVMRTGMTRARAEGEAVLWALDLGGVADVPVESKGWLLVSVPAP